MSQRANANTNQQGGGVGYLGQISTRNTRGCGLLGPMLHQYPDEMGNGMGLEMYTRYCANRMVIRYDSMRTQILCLILNEYQLILILYPYTAERRDVLENTPREAQEISQGPRGAKYPSEGNLKLQVFPNASPFEAMYTCTTILSALAGDSIDFVV